MKMHRYLGFFLASSAAFAVNADNPVSVNYVNQAIETAFRSAVQMTTYTAGTAIEIQNNVISGAYTGSSGVAVNGSVISGAYTGSSGVAVNGSVISGAYTGGVGITINGAEITQNPTYVIGDYISAGQGVVFWLDATQQHGLMVALEDQATSPICSGTTFTCPLPYTPGSGVGGGLINTAALMGAQLAKASLATNVSSHAPFVASAYSPAGFSNWYLPSITELNILQGVIRAVNDTLDVEGTPIDLSTVYWSSTYSAGETRLWARDMGTNLSEEEQTALLAVRSISQF